MPSRSALNTFIDYAQQQMRIPVDNYYRAVGEFGANSMQARVAQSLAKTDLERTLRSIHTQAAVLGNAGSLDADAKNILQDIIAQDTGYVNRFVSDLPNLSQGQALTRASLYANTAKGTVSDIATLALPTLPIYPRDSRLDCSWHCKCATDVRHLYGEGNFDVYWLLDQRGGVEHCPSCIRLGATWVPLQIRNWKIVTRKSISQHDVMLLQKSLKGLNLRDFDPSQPRDENGQWSDTGGGSIGGNKPTTDWERTIASMPPEQRRRVAEALGIPVPSGDKPTTRPPAPHIPRATATRHSRTQAKKLSPEELHGVKQYTSNIQYETINSTLRKTGSTDQLPAGLKYTTEQLDKALSKNTLPSESMLFRARKRLPDDWKVGTVITDKAYVSTTTELKQAEEFAGVGHKGPIMRIRAPKGTKGMFTASVSEFPEESEFLLPRNQKFKITGIKKEDGKTYVDMELTP